MFEGVPIESKGMSCHLVIEYWVYLSWILLGSEDNIAEISPIFGNIVIFSGRRDIAEEISRYFVSLKISRYFRNIVDISTKYHETTLKIDGQAGLQLEKAILVISFAHFGFRALEKEGEELCGGCQGGIEDQTTIITAN